MNSRILVGVAGLIILALGIAGLIYPFNVMVQLGLAVPSQATSKFVLGEIRATYGGVFIVMGIYTLLSLVDPVANRGRLTFIALMWLGAAVGRLVGTTVDGSPGVFGWLALAFEILIGAMLLVAAWMPASPPEIVPTSASMPMPPSQDTPRSDSPVP